MWWIDKGIEELQAKNYRNKLLYRFPNTGIYFSKIFRIEEVTCNRKEKLNDKTRNI